MTLWSPTIPSASAFQPWILVSLVIPLDLRIEPFFHDAVLYAQPVPTLLVAGIDETKASLDAKRVTNLSARYRNVGREKAFSDIFVSFAISRHFAFPVIPSISQTVVFVHCGR
jgi:hypothetical protein